MGGNISSEKSANCSDIRELGRNLRSVLSEEGDIGDEGEEAVPDDELNIDLDYDMEEDMEDGKSPSERENDAEEKKASFFTIICTSRTFPEAGEKDFVHWVRSLFLA